MFGSWMKTDGSDEDYPLPRTLVVPINSSGRYIRIQLPHTDPISLAEVEVFSEGRNLALGRITQQSSDNNATNGLSDLAVDGNVDGNFANGSVTQTAAGNVAIEPWWQVDLGSEATIDSIRIWNRTDSFPQRNKGFYLFVSDTPFGSGTLLSTMIQTGNSWYTQPGIMHYPTGSELSDIGLIPTYYGRPEYNYHIALENPDSRWSMAAGPYEFTVNTNVDRVRAPSSFEKSNGFLNSLQLAGVNNLTSICIGDEEGYNPTLVSNLKAWYDIAKSKYPNVIVHNNQSMWEWSDGQLRSYIATAQPDLISKDYYYFWGMVTGAYPGNSWSVIMGDFQGYRNDALAGIDGSGKSPINYGAYIQGFAGGCCGKYNYYPSESELNIGVYSYLVMGAKWLNIFRYVGVGNQDFFVRTDGSLTPQYWFYANLNNEIRNLSPHLSRLRSTDLRILPGQNLSGGAVAGNDPHGITAWDSLADPYIKGIAITNLVSGTNSGLKGDVTIGYYNPVAGLNNTPGITMAPVPGMDTRYFMVMNGLDKPNGCCNPLGSPGISQDTIQGRAIYAKQRIALNIDFKSNPVDTLYRVRRNDGLVEMVNLTRVSGTQYSFADTLDGGKADLFFWKNAASANSGSITGGTYKLVSAINDTSVLDVQGAGTSNGTPVQLYHSNSTAAQQWVITSAGNGYYNLRPANAPGKALDVAAAGSANGTRVQIWDSNGTSAQKWKITPANGRYYNLSPACAPGSNLDVNGASSADGTKVQVWSSNITPAQKWRFVQIAPPAGAGKTTTSAAIPPAQLQNDAPAVVKLYPNPVTDGILNIDLSSPATANAVILIYDMTGKPVYNIVKNFGKGPGHMVINVASLPAGMYILQIKHTDRIEQFKFIKK